jgi:TM2 domain-containing membrane protein YozV
MYHVIGGDGNQYGPIPEATVRAWLGEGRVSAESLSFLTGEAQWVPLRARPEFADLFPVRPTGAPPAGPPPGPAQVTPDAPKDWLVAILLSIFLGYFGIDRFYLGYTGLGIAKLLITIFTCGIAGWVWWLIDVILIAAGNLTDAKGRALVRY